MKVRRKMIDSFNIHYLKNGTSACTVGLGIGTTYEISLSEMMIGNIMLAEAIQLRPFIAMNFEIQEKTFRGKADGWDLENENLIFASNKAYGLLDPSDRDEMNIWDTTILDGLKE